MPLGIEFVAHDIGWLDDQTFAHDAEREEAKFDQKHLKSQTGPSIKMVEKKCLIS